MLLRLTDGTTTITLTSSPWLGATYFPASEGDTKTVTETAICTIEGSDAAIRTAVQGVESMLWMAAHRKELLGPRIFVEWRPLDSGDVVRSEIFDGRVTWSTDPARRRLGGTTSTIEIAVTWERANWLEDTTLTELQLSTSNQAAATGGRSIVNHDDTGTGDDNWVQIAAAQVAGVEPAPLMLSLANAAGGARTYARIYVAVNAMSDPGNLVHQIEAEGGSGGSVQSDANCSNGNKLRVAINPTATVYLPLAAALLQDLQGRDGLLIMRSVTMNGPVTVTPKIFKGTTQLWRGEPVTVQLSGSGLWNLGVAPLPPGGYLTSWGALSLGLEMRADSSVTWDIDFVQVTPLDSFRVLEFFPNTSIANGGAIVDDNIEGVAYVNESGSYTPQVAPRGEPLKVFPGKLQRVLVLQQTGSGAVIADALTVRAWYRKRWKTIQA